MKIWTIIFISLFFSEFLFAQEDLLLDKETFTKGDKSLNSVWRQVRISEDFYKLHNRGGYIYALEGYLMGYEYVKNYPELNYKIGICYLNSVYKPKSLEFLKKAYNAKKNVAKDILWQLGLAYQYNYLLDSAIMFFQMDKQTADTNIHSIEKINRKIEQCKRLKTMMKHPADVDIEDIEEINTEFPEYCPVIVADESRIYFTARRPDCVGGNLDPADGEFYEDIYFSDYIDGHWQTPKNIGFPLNTRFHDATVALSPDGNSMLIFRNGDLLICHKKGDKWSFPEYLPDNINTEELENSACFSFDGKTIYFVRGKKQNPDSSNSDIYVTHFQNGQWSDPVKLPPVINSPYDEDGVFLHPDGKTLYFSSMGHGSIGGFDIFKSVLQPDGTWSEPENLGYPINSPDDDVYFVLSADGKTAYFSSVRNNTKGFSDIYKITIHNNSATHDTNLIAQNDNIKKQQTTFQNVNLVLVVGNVYDAITLDPIPEASIEIYDNKKDSLLMQNFTDEAGKFVVTLPSGRNYGMNVNADGYLFHSENFDIPENSDFDKVRKDIPLYNVTAGSKVILKNIFFDFDKATLRKESIPELERVYKFMTDNPKIVIEISGHTDNVGSHEYNEKLSEARAKAVVTYLINKGIPPQRLKYRGAAYDEPIVPNDTPEHRQLNRRVEFKILSNE